jgi:hypothetical protein
MQVPVAPLQHPVRQDGRAVAAAAAVASTADIAAAVRPEAQAAKMPRTYHEIVAKRHKLQQRPSAACSGLYEVVLGFRFKQARPSMLEMLRRRTPFLSSVISAGRFRRNSKWRT